ncbi:hypothetical protein BaRGS_00000944 [Batillaria attramentaria]|uniref:Uncharacterized protein n=1 Tax=Batillaria attramentaria TaxID=370345 RepID=A0ABD0M7N7_9CAEN
MNQHAPRLSCVQIRHAMRTPETVQLLLLFVLLSVIPTALSDTSENTTAGTQSGDKGPNLLGGFPSNFVKCMGCAKDNKSDCDGLAKTIGCLKEDNCTFLLPNFENVQARAGCGRGGDTTVAPKEPEPGKDMRAAESAGVPLLSLPLLCAALALSYGLLMFDHCQ